MDIKKQAEILKGEALVSRDGIDIHNIEKIENSLSIIIPEKLKEFYINIGNLKFITQSFERFLPLDELEVKENKLYFIEENQGVCAWAVDLETLQIYQDNNDEFYDEEIQLNDFLRLVMYYNCAQGGLPFAAQGKAERVNDVLVLISDKWEMVANHNGLLIYANEDNLIWAFVNGDILVDNSFFLSFRNTDLFEEYSQKLNTVIL